MVSDIGWVYGGVLYGNREGKEFNVRGNTPSPLPLLLEMWGNVPYHSNEATL
jgi:hypothetical protein